MFIQAALQACVFCFETFSFFFKVSVLIRQSVRFFHAWPKRESSHTEDGNFQLREIIIFLECRACKAAWANMGLKRANKHNNRNQKKLNVSRL